VHTIAARTRADSESSVALAEGGRGRTLTLKALRGLPSAIPLDNGRPTSPGSDLAMSLQR